MDSQLWYDASIVALDLEGSGAQDRDAEAILELAAVPLVQGEPELSQAFTSLINPGRPIPRRRWISPGLTNTALNEAPPLEEIADRLLALIDGRWLLGHNVNVDWRLLSKHLPALRPAGLIDTLALARSLGYTNRSLSALVEQLGLKAFIQSGAENSQPHRAHWDTVATAYLLPKLVRQRWPAKPPTFESLRLAAGISLGGETHEQQPRLFS